jgi:hypothetical protein
MTRNNVGSVLSKLLLSAAMTVVCAAGVRADVTVGQYDSGNSYPFSGFASDGGSVYQQIYASSEFPGLISFNSITFYRDDVNTPLGSLMDSASYTVSFSTTSAALAGLDSDPNNNIGGDSAFFGSYSLSGAMPATLTLTGNTFSYNPGAGNLLMTVVVDGLTEGHAYESYFQADYTGAVTRRLYINSFGTNPSVAGALVTTFGTTAQDVPEPGTLAFGLIGAGSFVGFIVRKRRA